MRDSNVANAAKESAQAEFPHGLLEFCATREGAAAFINQGSIGSREDRLRKQAIC
jgi:hypothetical protein